MSALPWRTPSCGCQGEHFCDDCSELWGRVEEALEKATSLPASLRFYQRDDAPPLSLIGPYDAPSTPSKLPAFVRVDVGIWIELSDWQGRGAEFRAGRLAVLCTIDEMVRGRS